MELEALQEVEPEIRALGARLVAISPEIERYARFVHRKFNLTFDILTDLHLETAQRFGLVYVLPDYLRELYKTLGNTLDRFNDEAEYRLPLPARYVIDSNRIIRLAEVNADYTIRPEPSDTVRFLREISTMR